MKMKQPSKKRNTLVTAFLLVAFLFGFASAPQPVLAAACDQALFIADVTIPDGTNFGPGTSFNKTWRLQNIGSCTWSTGYSLVFVNGAQMGPTTSVNLPTNVVPGATVDLTVPLTAPNTVGIHRANWQLRNAAGTLFGIGAYANLPFWAEITVVSGSNTATPLPPATPIPSATFNPGRSACDRASFIGDVNVPDGTVFAANTPFTKTWSIKNIGTCTWTTGYQLVFISGDKLGGPDTVNITSTVGPNTTYNISVNLVSPATAGSYRGYWQLKNTNNQIFGISSTADKPWWVDIVVNISAPGSTSVPTSTPSAGPTFTPTKTATVGPAAATPTRTTTPAPLPSGVVYDFSANAGAATWTTGAGPLTFDGPDPSANGVARRLTNVKMEDGSTIALPSLLMIPNDATTSYITGIFPAFTVRSGDHFNALVGCQHAANACYVKFWLDYQIGSAPLVNLINWTEKTDGAIREADIDLYALDGKSVTFILTVGAFNGTTGSQDRAVWVAPRITR
jgi:hypothetical protein